MKKTFLSIIAVLLCIFSANAQTEKRNYSAKNFTGISASHIFSIEITKGNKYNVSIEAPASVFELIKIRQSGDKVDFSLKNELPRSLRDITESITVRITMPYLTEIELSGASKLSGNGVFSSKGKEIEIELSGASRIKDLCVEAPKVSIDASGASRAELFADTKEMEAEASGASKILVTGNVARMKAEISGASALDAKNINCNYMDLEADGASKAIVCVQETLKVDLSGAAKCEYIGPEDVNLRIDSISGASTLRRVR